MHNDPGNDLVDPFTWPCIFLLSRLAQSIEIEVVLEESRPDVSLKPDTPHRTAAEHSRFLPTHPLNCSFHL